MKIKDKLFASDNIRSAVIFFAFIGLYTTFLDIEFNLLTILIFTILFWLGNSLQAWKKEKPTS